MILDKLENLEKYASVHPRFAVAIPFLQKLVAENAENGKHEMPNGDVPGAVYANVMSYDAKPMGDAVQMEVHHRYIDIQIMMEGEEYMYIPASIDGSLAVTRPYTEESDCEKSAMPAVESATRLTVPKGYFAIFFPNELHAPSVSMKDVPTQVHKIVGKVLN